MTRATSGFARSPSSMPRILCCPVGVVGEVFWMRTITLGSRYPSASSRSLARTLSVDGSSSPYGASLLATPPPSAPATTKNTAAKITVRLA